MVLFRVSYNLFSHLAILLGLLLVQSCEGQTWADFQNKHIDFPQSSAPNHHAYCDLMMLQRNLNQRYCGGSNIFINEDPAVIAALCYKAGNRNVESSQYFSMFRCTHSSGQPPRNCSYHGRSLYLRIRVQCRNGLPVHLLAIML